MASQGKFDYREFARLYKNMQSIQDEFLSFLEDFLLQEAAVALRLVRPRTPVDTGNLRRNWQISDVQVYGSFIAVYLVNPVEYASFMEHGFTYHTSTGDRRFPGFHMAELSILQVQQKMPARFEAAFNRWLRSKGWR